MAFVRAAECGKSLSLTDISRLVTVESGGDKYLNIHFCDVETTGLECGETDSVEDLFNQLLLYDSVTDTYALAAVAV